MLLYRDDESFISEVTVPSASLNTPNGTQINPTGACNTYLRAYVACRARGSSAEEAAIFVNAFSGVVCENENLHP